MASRTINCKRRRARACACVRVHGRETCMCAGVNVHVRLAASGFIWPGVYVNKQVAIAAREHPLRYFKGKSDIEGRPLTQLTEQRAMPTLRKRQGIKDTKTCWHQRRASSPRQDSCERALRLHRTRRMVTRFSLSGQLYQPHQCYHQSQRDEANFREHDRTWKMTAVSTWRRATSAMNLDSVLTKPNMFTSIASNPPFRACEIASVSRPPLRPEPQGHQVQEYLGMGFEGRQSIQGPLRLPS